MPQMTDPAYEYYLMGVTIRENPAKFNSDGIAELREAFENATEEDENASQAYAELAYSYVREYQHGSTKDPDATLKTAEGHANHSLGINDDFDGHWNLTIVYWNQGKFLESFEQYDTAAHRWKHRVFDPDFKDYVALRAKDSRNPDLTADEGEAWIYDGNADVAIERVEEAIKIRSKMDDQFSAIPHWYWWIYARACYMAKRYWQAIDAAGRISDPANDVLLITAASKAQLGDLAAARAEIAKFSKNDPEWSIAKAAERYFCLDSDRQHWLDGLRKAGLKEE